MNHKEPDETAQLFDQLRRAVEPTVEVEASLADLHDRAGTPQRVAARPWALLGALAAALVLVGGTVALWPSTEPAFIDAAGGLTTGGDPASRDDSPPIAPCDDAQVLVHLHPDASQAMVDEVSVAILAFNSSESVEFIDRELTSREFERLFVDQPELVDAISADELPQSFRITPTEPWTDTQADGIEELDGVRQVLQGDDATDSRCPVPSAAQFEVATTSTTTTTIAVQRPADLSSADVVIDEAARTLDIAGATLDFADSTVVLSCGPTDERISLPISEALSRGVIGDVNRRNEVFVWLAPSPDGSPPGEVLQIAVGTCG